MLVKQVLYQRSHLEAGALSHKDQHGALPGDAKASCSYSRWAHIRALKNVRPQGLLTHRSACVQQAGTVQWEGGCGHRGVGEHGLGHRHSRIGANRTGLDHTDRWNHHRGLEQLAGILVVGQVNPLPEAGPWRLTSGEMVVHGKQALSKALPPAKQGPAPQSASVGNQQTRSQGCDFKEQGKVSQHFDIIIIITNKILNPTCAKMEKPKPEQVHLL